MYALPTVKKLISKYLSTVKITCKSDKYLCKEMSHFLNRSGTHHTLFWKKKKKQQPTFYRSQLNFYLLFFFFFFFLQNKVSRIRFEFFIIVMQQMLFFFSSLLKNLINKYSLWQNIFLLWEDQRIFEVRLGQAYITKNRGWYLVTYWKCLSSWVHYGSLPALHLLFCRSG